MPGITSTTNLKITWTPRGVGAVAQTILLDVNMGRLPSRFDDGPEWFKQTTVTEGGTAVTIIHDVFYEVTIRIESIQLSHDLPGNPLWALLQNWWMHCGSGGLFGIALSRERSSNFTLSGIVSQGAVSADPGGNPTGIPRLVKENDSLIFEHVDDPTLAEYVIADADGTTAPDNITFLPALSRDYPSGSLVRFADFHENCLALQTKHPLKRRKNSFLWDFQIKLRTTRV